MIGSARRTCPEDYAQALGLMQRGISAQNIRKITGCDVTSLRSMSEAPPYAVARSRVKARPEPSQPLSRSPEVPATAEVERVLVETAARYGLTTDDLFSASKSPLVAWPRQEAMWRMSQELKMSLWSISDALGLHDHSCVHWGIRRHEARLLWGEILRHLGGGL